MTPHQQDILAGLLLPLRAAHQGGKLPHDALVQRARAVLRLADKDPRGLTEQDQVLLDELHGLTKWAGLVYPLTRLDPATFAAERRDKRQRQPAVWQD